MENIDKFIISIIGDRPTEESIQYVANKRLMIEADLAYWKNIEEKLNVWESQAYAIKMALERSKRQNL